MILILAKHLPSQANATSAHSSTAIPRDDASATRAFESIIPVLRHPRCINCHSQGDSPRQSDDSHPHTMNVRRGPDGEGVAGVKCSACHQDHNLFGLHVPPGAPDWHLPSPNMPMIWEGLSDHQLCELFKDPKQNGGRTIDQIVVQMSTPLVLWGWKSRRRSRPRTDAPAGISRTRKGMGHEGRRLPRSVIASHRPYPETLGPAMNHQSPRFRTHLHARVCANEPQCLLYEQGSQRSLGLTVGFLRNEEP